jgi:putative membrane protein
MNADFTLFAKGVAMGAANVIPGVSGGTIALVTGIYQRLISALGSIGPTTIKQLLSGDWRGFLTAIDARWLTVLMVGVAVSIVTLAKLFDWLLVAHEQLTMAFFFGLILASIVYGAQRVTHWTGATWVALASGIAIALAIALLAPSGENAAPWYVFLCGVVAIASMILPGLSGSFVLILMGNYALVLGAISRLDFGILIPLAAGCAIGLVAFSHALKWIFERYANATLALMTGFVVGSLAIIWPWKHTLTGIIQRDGGETKTVVTGYDWYLPGLDATTGLALLLAVMGAALIILMERVARD